MVSLRPPVLSEEPALRRFRRPTPHKNLLYLYRAGRDCRDRLPEQGSGLRHPLPGDGRDPENHRSRSEALGGGDRLLRRTAHVGSESPAEPSLMMPGIIISFVFSEQRRLIFHTAPVEN